MAKVYTMSKPPDDIRIFHITAECNLPSIFCSEALLAKNISNEDCVEYSNIAYQGAQRKRSSKRIIVSPYGLCHDYVPFYFAPRSPMLNAINNGNVEGCDHRQPDIVHFYTNIKSISSQKLEFVFFDINATLDTSTAYNDIKDLDKIDWELFFEYPRLDGYCQYWFSDPSKPRYAKRMETRMAEFLVHNRVPLNALHGIGVYNAEIAVRVRTLCAEYGVDICVEAKPNWYF